MTATFLKHLEFRDFRTFGRFELDLPPAPGLTLVVGPNGLGKSTFFDGIEWCLSGHIRRFSEYIGRRGESEYLTRRDAMANSHSVSMTFSSGAKLTRTARSAPDTASLMAVLKKENWGDIKNLDAYLALTHFLGQAAQQRFTSRSKNDQWQALKGPSGIDRLEQVRTALRGRAATSAFSTRLRRETAEIEVAAQALSKWRDDSARLEQLRASVVASGAPTAQGIEQALAILTEACDVTLGKATGIAASEDPTRRIITLRRLIEKAKSDTIEAQDKIELLHGLASRYAVLSAASDLNGLAISTARQTVADSTAMLTEAMLVAKGGETAVSKKAEEEAAAREALARSSALVSAATTLAETSSAHTKLIEQHDTLTAHLVTAEQERTRAEQALTIAREQRVKLASLEEQRLTRQHAVERVTRLIALQHDAQVAAARATNTRADADIATPLITQLQTFRSDVETQIVKAEADYHSAQRKASDLADALATVAKHLNDHDEQCPVCTASYPSGTIKLLAETAARNQNGELTGKAQTLETLRRSLEDTSSKLLLAREQDSRAKLAQTEAEATAHLARDAHAELARLLDAADGQDLVVLANQRLAATTHEIMRLEAEIAPAPATVAELQAAADRTRLTHEALTEELARVEKLVTNNLQRIAYCREALGEETATAGLDALIVHNQSDRSAFETAQARLAAARIELASVIEIEGSARQRLIVAEMAMTQTQTNVAQARSERENLVREWRMAGYSGEPSDIEVSAQGTFLAHRMSALERHEKELDRLIGAVQELTATAELESLLTRMAATSDAFGVADPTLYERELIAQLDKARAAHQATTETQEAVNAYTEQLKGKAEQFSANFLEPLNDLIDDFNRALLSTPGETVQFSADAAINRTSLGMKLRYADELDNARYDTKIAPQLVLSEGQMAANGFSILCATSVAYKWSNWQALLLDDPLQHNDIIHAAAFADVMRNLAEYENYQLLMSSHDRAEGEFLFRKFDAAGLPCTMVTLTAPSREGVLCEPPRYNAAASQRMAAGSAVMG